MKENWEGLNWDAIAEVVALVILGIITVVAMCELSVNGKEIALAIGSGIGGYLTKTAIGVKKGG